MTRSIRHVEREKTGGNRLCLHDGTFLQILRRPKGGSRPILAPFKVVRVPEFPNCFLSFNFSTSAPSSGRIFLNSCQLISSI
jgi:hypothetical protein